MYNAGMEPGPDIRAAYARAVNQYKPWHQFGAWNSTGHDAFWQLIRGGLENGFFDLKKASEMFGAPTATVLAWAGGEIPERKTRIRVWKTLKRVLN